MELPEKRDKKKEITKAAKQLITDEQRMVHSDSVTEISKEKNKKHNKESKKNDTTKQKSFNWEISNSDSNVSNNESVTKCSWDVSDTTNPDKVKSNKRTNVEKDTSISDSTVKKIKTSSFSVSDSKENSFSSPVASTPKSLNKSNVLKKSTSNTENVCDRTSTENSSSNQQSRASKKRIRILLMKQNKCQALKNGSTNNSFLDKSNVSLKNKNFLTNEQSNNSTPDESTEKKKNNDKEDIQLNTTSEKNNGWGGEWDEPCKDVEYEIFIPNKKYVEKRKSLGLSYPLPAFFQKSAEKVTPINKLKVSY